MKDYSGVYQLKNVRVVTDKQEQKRIIKVVHEGSEDSVQATALSSHHGMTTTKNHLSRRYYWQNFTKEVEDYINNCASC